MNTYIQKIRDMFERYRLYRQLLPTNTPYNISKKLYKKSLTLRTLGIVEMIEVNHNQYPDEPFQHCVAARPHGYGHDFFSFESALERALGEAVERHLWRNSDSLHRKIKVLTQNEASKEGALTLETITGFSKDQISQNPRFQYNHNTPFAWIPTQSLTSKETILSPLQLFSARFATEGREPLLRGGTTIGLATGTTRQQALLKSILELIEREAFMITYLNSLSPDRVDIEALAKEDQDIAAILKNIKKHKITPYVTTLVTDFPVPVMLGVLVDDTDNGPVYSVGACASFDTKNAIVRSLSEALIIRQSIKHTYKNFTGDIDARGRLHYWAQPAQRGKLDFLLAGKMSVPSLTQKVPSHTEQLSIIRAHAKEHNCHFFTTTLSNQRLHDTGYHSVMTMSPELHPMHLEESLHSLNSPRLKSVPATCGYAPSDILNPEPHPFP